MAGVRLASILSSSAEREGVVEELAFTSFIVRDEAVGFGERSAG